MKMETKKTTRGPSREYNYALAAADEMYRTLSAKQPGLAETSLQEDLKKLNVDAWKIALLLRSSRNVYEWDQPVKNFNSYPPEEVERIPLDGISLEELPCRTLFGPLYKVANGEKALVRSGEVLVGP